MPYSREAPSARYTELLDQYNQVHTEGLADQDIVAENAFAGTSLKKHLHQIRSLLRATQSRTLLDYGSGKGVKYEARDITVKGERAKSVQDYWGLDSITCFDPGYPPFAAVPQGTFDAVICIDVLEHIPDLDLPWMLEEQFRFARKVVFANIASYPASKTLPNGENAHCTIEPASWWRAVIERAHTASGSTADYLFTVETKVKVASWFGLKIKFKPRFEYISNRADWQTV